MKDMNDTIKDYCKKKGYADFVIEGGLDYLVPSWERTVAHIARDYSRMMKEEYLNDMDGRRILHEVLQIATEAQRKQVEARIKAADETYFAHTVAVDVCIWGERNEKKYGYSPQVDWWYYRGPKVRDANW